MRLVRTPIWLVLAFVLAPFSAPAAELFVNQLDPSCLGRSPCFSSIQAAIDQAGPGDSVQVQPGTYRESLRIRKKNDTRGAGEADRITIGRAPDAPPDSVILVGTAFGRDCRSPAILVSDSRFVTIRGLVITGARAGGIRLAGRAKRSAGVRIESNRIYGNGSAKCGGGVVIRWGNHGTVVANNLIYANAGDGIDAADEPRGSFAQAVRGSADREPRYLVQNTIHANLGHGIVVSRVGNLLLANNAVTSNGAGEGFGVFRRPGPRGRSLPDIRVSNNLICDNRSGEVSEGILGQNQSGNATPTGSEAEGVSASPECQDSTGVYQNAPGSDDLAGTGDDDFALTLPRSDGPPSPAIDRGTDPRGLGLDSLLEPVLLADFSAPAVRPIQRDTNRTGDFDIGAVEIPCDCHENCESCRIAIEEDGSSLDQCPGTYSGEQCCNRITGEVTEKHEGAAYEVCPDTRSQRPGFDSGSSSDGCSAVPDHPLLLCPEVRFGCDEDSGVEGCGEGIDLPCNNHDFCYQTCGTTQALCDVAFYDDMIRVCNEMSFGQKLVCYDDCVIRAGAYFDGVAFGPFGRDAFVNGQNRACQCCQNVFPEEAELGMSLLRD